MQAVGVKPASDAELPSLSPEKSPHCCSLQAAHTQPDTDGLCSSALPLIWVRIGAILTVSKWQILVQGEMSNAL